MKLSTKLTQEDVQDLLNDFRSELRKLKVKSDHIRFQIRALENYSKDLKEGKVSQPGPGRPRKESKKKAPRKPYPLSDWDKLILESIKKEGKVLINPEIYERVKPKAKEVGIFTTDAKARAKLNQCLIKLANRRNDLVKVKYKGRGFAYAMPEWMDGRKLKKEYKR
ncbi:MAG: hypothetical protein R6T99_00370 [Bacteroidales bacterium]